MGRLKVYTGEIYSYKNMPDGLDISVMTAKEKGQPFTPTWNMVRGWKNKTLSMEQYVAQYREKMRNSLRQNPKAWDGLLQTPRVTLLCYCHNGEFCHRYVLAAMLVLMGAEYMGEAKYTKNGIEIDESTIPIVNYWVEYLKANR